MLLTDTNDLSVSRIIQKTTKNYNSLDSYIKKAIFRYESMKKIAITVFNYWLSSSLSQISSATLLAREGYDVHIFIIYS